MSAAAYAAALEHADFDPRGMFVDATVALEKARQAGDEAAELEALYDRLLVADAPFEWPDSNPSVEQDLQRAETLAKQQNDFRRLAGVYLMLGAPSLRSQAAPESQAKHLAAAEKLIDTGSFNDLAVRLHLVRCWTLTEQGRRAEAMREAMAGHKLALALPSGLLAAQALTSAALSCCSYPGAGRLDLERSLGYYTAALALVDPARHRTMEHLIHASLARVLTLLNRHAEALQHAQAELALAQALRVEFASAYSMIGIARLERELGHAARSLDWLDRAEALLRKTTAPEAPLGKTVTTASVAISLQVGRARTLAQLGRRQDSLDALRVARSMLDSMPVVISEGHVFFHEAAAEVFSLAGDSKAAFEAMRSLRKAEKDVIEQADLRLLERVQAESSMQLKDAENARLRAEQREMQARRWILALAAGISTLLLMALAAWQWQRGRLARAHAASLQALVAEEGRRAVLLAESKATLERLATIGQEITAHLDEQTVFCALHRHVGALLDAPSIAVWLLDANNSLELLLRFGVEDGAPLPQLRVALDNTTSNAARSARERREIFAERALGDPDAAHIAGTREMLSALFAPLVSGGHLHGVLSIQSARPHAYGEREQQIFRTLCAYGAVALANAAAARQLAEAHTELAHEKMRNMLVHAGKMVTIGRLASGLVHEMAHPVGTVTMLNDTAQALLAENRPSEAGSLMRRIVRETDRLQGLIRRLRDFARSDAPGLAPVNLRDVLVDARVLFEPRMRAECVDYDEQVAAATVAADPERLALVIANVVFNALDAMAASESPHRRAIEVRSRIEGRFVTLTLRDFGAGLSPDVQSHLFEPFFTTKPQGQGLGLGLALSNESMASMNGRIEANNHPGGGAVFSVILPVAGRKS